MLAREFSFGRTRTKRTPMPRQEDAEDVEDVRGKIRGERNAKSGVAAESVQRHAGKPDRFRSSRKLKTE
jgi:hypothetical protein